MQNEMRDRLVEIFKQNGVGEAFSPLAREDWRKDTADVLLANGVIVPPCKVGDTVYCIFRNAETLEYYIAEKIVYEVSVSKYGMRIFISPLISFIEMEIGKRIFLTKEEAEKALKEGADNG